MKRTFTISKVDIKNADATGGRYEGKAPYGVAKKVCRAMFKIAPKKKQIRFTIKETTRNSENKEFTYIGKKHKLDEPKIFKRGDTEIKVTHEYIIKRYI